MLTDLGNVLKRHMANELRLAIYRPQMHYELLKRKLKKIGTKGTHLLSPSPRFYAKHDHY